MTSLQGCTIGWLELRQESSHMNSQPPSLWECPEMIHVSYSGGTYTRTGGERKYDEVRANELREEYLQSTLSELGRVGCRPQCFEQCFESDWSRSTLEIEINEMQYLSATGGEYITGLSFGLIPSWDTREAELRFKMLQYDRVGIYVVDDKRFNHIIVFPIFWLSFLMPDEQQKFVNALQDYINRP